MNHIPPGYRWSVHLPLGYRWSVHLFRLAIFGLLVVLGQNSLHADIVIVNYSGQLTCDITVGENTIPDGSRFSGQLSYDFPQSGVTTTFFGGTQSEFTFNSLTLTIGSQTVTEKAGQIGLYNDVFPPNGVPVGDSFYTFVPGVPNNSPGTATGSVFGVTPDYIYIGLTDPSGNAFSGPALPQSLNLSEFSLLPQEAFLGVDYGPFGTGNTDSIFFLSSLTSTTVPEPGSATLLVIGMCVLSAIERLRRKRRTDSLI